MRTHWLFLAVIAAACYTSALFAQDSGAPPEPPAATGTILAQTEAQRLSQAAEQAAPPPEPPTPPVASPAVPPAVPAPPPAAEATVAPGPTPAPTPGSGLTPLNFNNADMGVVLKYLSDKTGKPVLKSEAVTKQVTLINPRAQTDAENLRLLYKVLSSMGIAVVDAGELIMVLPLTEARKVQVPVISGEKPEAGAEDIMTFSRQLKFTKAKDMVDRLKPMVRDGDALTADEGSNTLFYTDTRSYVERFTNLVDLVDQEKNQQITTVSRAIKNASASEILKPCLSFLETYATVVGDGPPRTTIRVEPSLNTLIIRGPAREVAAVGEIIERLDVSPKVEVPPVVQRRPVNYADPQALIQSAEAFLRRFIQVGGLIGDVPKTSLVYEPSTRELIIKGPAAEVDVLMPVLDELDKPRTTRSRKLNYADPRTVVDEAIQHLLKDYAESGRPGYKHSITWKTDPFNSSMMVFRGPTEELDLLFPILDQLDKPVTTQTRRFFKHPEQVFPEALNLLVDQYLHEGISKPKPVTTWRRDPLNPAMIIMRGPEEELTRLAALLDQLDKPLVERTRPIYSATPEVVIPAAIERMVKRFEEEGQPDIRPSITWKREEFNPSILVFKGPPAELDRLFPILDQLDKPLTKRTRQFYSARPEEAIPGALERLVRQMAEEGNTSYRTATTWQREEFNPSIVIFRGPPAELDLLFPILDNLDKPLVLSSRAITYASAEEVIPIAQSRLKQYFKDQGRPEYEPITTFRVDPVNRNLVMRGPQEEITALTTILTEIDIPRAQTTNLTTQEFAYNLAQPADLIKAASSFLARRVALEGKPGDKPGVTYQVNPLTRSISMHGPAAQLPYVVSVMTAVEQTTRRDSKPLIIYPKRTTAAQLYSDLSQLVTAAYPTGSAPQLVQLPRLDALVVSARPEDQARLEEWIDILDSEGAGAKTIKMIPIENTTPSTIAGAIRSLMPTTSAVFYPDDAANRLIIRDSTAAIEQAVRIIKELDQPIEGEDIVLEVKNLKSASVYYVYSALNEFSNQLAQFRGKAKTKARVVYEPTSSSILLFGKKDDVKQLLEVADKLDVVALGDSKPRIIQLKNAQATQVYSQLNQVIPTITNKQTPPVIIPDTRMNSLLVAASPADVTKVVDLIEGLDSPSSETFEPTIVKIENAEATSLSSTLSYIMTGAGKIYSDYRSNSLIILDTKANVERLMPFIKQLDTAEGTEDMTLEVYKAESAYVYYLYNTLSEYASRLAQKKGKTRAKAIVQFDPYTSNLILLGERQEVKDLLDLATKLDKVPFADTKPTFIYLKNAEAAQVASRLSTITPNLTSQQNPPRIMPDTRLNMLIVAGSPTDASKIQEIVKAMDVPGSGLLTHKLVKLENAEASTLYSMIQQLLSEAGKAVPDYRTNSLLILDSTDSITRVMPIIEKLDTAESKENFVVRVVQVKTPNVYAIYTPVSEYVERMSTAKGTQQRGRPMVSVDPSTQAIIAIGREDDVKDIVRIANELDKLQWQGQEPEFFQIKNAIASTVANVIRQLMPSMAKGGASAQIINDDRLNILIVLAQPGDVDRIRSLVEKLDVPDTGGDLIAKIIKLKSAPASSVYLPAYTFKSPRGYVTYDNASNSIVIRDTTASLERLEKLIATLDTDDAKNLATKIIPLKTAPAASVYGAISALKSPRGLVTYDTNSNSVLIRDITPEVQRLEKIVADLDTSGAIGEWVTEVRMLRQIEPSNVVSLINHMSSQMMTKKGKNRQSMYAYSEPTSGSLIIIGPTEEVKPALDLVDQLETAGKAGGKIRLFFLKYTKAMQLASQLRDVFRTARTTAGQAQTTVLSDQFTNSLIVIGSDTDLQRMDELVAKLDIPNAAGLEVEIFPVEGVSATQLVTYLKALSGPQGELVGDSSTNSLVVIDTRDVIQRIGKVVKELGQKGGGITARIRKLEYGQAISMVTPITQYLTLHASRQGRTQPRSGVYAEPSTNAVIIFGPTDEVTTIEALITKLDTEEIAGREPRIFTLKYIQATQFIGQMSQMVAQSNIAGYRSALIAEPTTNSLILIAPERDVKRLESILEKIDVPEAGGLETRVYDLKRASAANLARNLGPPILSVRGKAFAETGTNMLIVTDTPESLERAKQFIDQIDLAKGEVISKIRRLENTSVTTLSQPLQQFISYQAQSKGLTQPMTQVMMDTASNSLIIYGPTDEVDLVMGLIQQLDAESLFEREPKIIPLRKAKAATIAPILEQLLALDRKGTNMPRVLADAETNSLIVMAPKADILRAEELLVTLDQTETPGVETRVFRLKNADAQALVANVRVVAGPQAKLFADVPSNSIVYTDTSANIEELGKLITQLDTPGIEGELITKVIPLRNTDAREVENTLSDFVAHISVRKGRQQRPLTRVTDDASTNSVVIIGPTDEVEQLTSLLAELDKDNLREREPQAYFLENAQATQVGLQISQIMAQISIGPNAARIVPNAENNALLVLASPADRAIIEQMIKTLDSPEGGLRRVHILQLKHADALQLVQSLRMTMNQTAAIAAHADSNSIIIADTDANVQKLTEIIRELDQESRPEDLASEVIPLVNSKAGALAQPLSTIISQFTAQRGRKNKPPLQSYADPEANSLVIIGSSDEVHQLGRIVKELDAESLSDRKPEVFFLEYARASDLATEIGQLFAQTAARMGPPAKVVPDTWANALLVIADPRDMEWVRRIIKELDTREGRKRVVEIFELENADASVLAERLQGLFAPGTDTGRGRRRGYYDYYDYFGGRRTETLTEGQVTIIADQRLNALIVTAEPQDMNQVADLIDALDIQAPNLEGPKVYHIENGEAETLAQTLQNLFSDTDYRSGWYYGYPQETSISGLSGKVRVTADVTTNSIIVMASSPRAFDVIEQMLKELDKPSVQSGRTNIIPVKNALAQDLKKLLTDLFRPEENAESSRRRFFFYDYFGGGGGGGGAGGSFSNLIGKVRIEADTRTNSLLVITPEMYRPSVEKLIESLDAPTAQVLLETLIVEVTLGDDCDQGIQWGVDPITGDVGKISIGNTEVLTFDNDRSEFFDSDSYGTSLFNTAADNLQFFSLNRTEFNAVINFLDSNRNLNVQSRPGILTENNRPALVRVGTRTPTITDISNTGGTTTTSVTYEELGLTLEVTPHINSATMVSLNIQLKDGAIDPTIAPLNGMAYTFTDREFKTQLKVTNHHTAVLAGVISEKHADTVHKVPFLNRLPYVGDKVFTNTSRSSEKVELLTFITPYILNSRADVFMATEMASRKSRSPVLRKMDLINGEWPEEYVDDQMNSLQGVQYQSIPNAPLPPPRR